MFKLVLIGLGVVGLLAFILWNLWKMALLKRKYFSQSETLFGIVSHFEDVPGYLKRIKAHKIKTWVIAILGSLLIVAIALAYFVVARAVFLSNHTHSYQSRVTTPPICITEGVKEYTCRYCDDKYEEAIPVIDHNYSETGRQEPICIQEGKIEYTCEMCQDVKEEPIPVIDHKYSEASRQDSTCTQEGTIEYACEMCQDIKTEPIELKDHECVQTIEMEATCTTEGVLATQCKHCDFVEKESIPTSDDHHFALLSFTEASFLKNGYVHYACRDCGHETYSPKAEAFNWVGALAIAIFLICLIIIIAIRSNEYDWEDTFGRGGFWFALLCIIPAILLAVVHWGFVLPAQNSNTPVLEELTSAPVECQLVEQERVGSSYTQNGTVLYQCQDCKKEYTEFLPLRKIDPDQIMLYTQPELKECEENEKNGKISKANDLFIHHQITGNLSSQKDVDFYKVTLLADGNIHFRFTHEADRYSNHWYATIYGSDQSTILNEGYIDKDADSFGCSDLSAGTYYLQISPISGGNPLLNNFSDENYHLIFEPVCNEHTETTQYFTEMPECLQSVEISTICNYCHTVVSVETITELEHSWGPWEIPEEGTTEETTSEETTSEEITTEETTKKIRTCSLCGETQTEQETNQWWKSLLKD